MSEIMDKVEKFNQKQIDEELKKALDFKPGLQSEIEEIIRTICSRLNPVSAFQKNGEISAASLIHLLLSARSALITEIINNHDLRVKNHFLKNKVLEVDPRLGETLFEVFKDVPNERDKLN